VVLEAVIGEDGLAQDIHVGRSLGYGCDELAVNTLRTWKFEPVKSDEGKPVAAKIAVEIAFQ
jgi:TonB family protein